MNLILTILETSGWFATEPWTCFHGNKWEFIDDSFLGEPLVWSVDLRWFKHRDMVNIRLIVFETIRLIAQKNSFGTPDSFYWDGLRTCHPSLLGMVLHIFSSLHRTKSTSKAALWSWHGGQGSRVCPWPPKTSEGKTSSSTCHGDAPVSDPSLSLIFLM